MQTELLNSSDKTAVLPLEDGINGFSIREALSLLDPLCVNGGRSGVITDIASDSRKVIPGACFVAVNGVSVDSHRFIPSALKSGASLVVAEKEVEISGAVTLAIVGDSRKALGRLSTAFYGYPANFLRLIGVTGTHGKTTTTYIIKHIAEHAGLKSGMLTTVQYDTGASIVQASQTTPDAVRLNKLLSEALEAGAEVMPMEVSSHSLCQQRVAGLRFRGAVFTNLASDHLDYHKTSEAYREAKAALFENLERKAFCVLNADDDNWRFYAKRTSAQVLTYSIKREADFKAVVRAADVSGVSFELVCHGRSYPVMLGLLGIHNIENALGAAACAISLGINPSSVAAALSDFDGVPGRLERIETGRDFSVFVDYAHTDGALETVLSNVKPFVKGRLIVVFGAGGDRDRGKRPRMARAAEKYADVCILTSDNPRSEDPIEIIREVESGFVRKNTHVVKPDRREAIETSLYHAQGGDVVVVAGKGHENYQIFADRTEHFDDREVVREILGIS